MISDRRIDQAFVELRQTYGGVREDYFGLLYLEHEHKLPRQQALNQITFGGNDYGIDAFHFDEPRRNLYLFQFKYSNSHNQFKASLIRLIEDGLERIFLAPNKDDAKNSLLLQLRSTTVSQSISRRPANDHSSDRADVEAARGPGARTPWRWTSGHGVQAAPGLPRGLKLLGSGAARRKARGAGGKSLARSAARKAYAAIHNAPW